MEDTARSMSGTAGRWLALLAFIVGVFAVGTVIGMVFTPGGWYAALTKPWFTPPNWLFGPVWSVLYLLIAIAGWRTVRADRDGAQTMLWFLQMALNFLWTPVVFGLHLLWPGVVVIAALWLTIAAFIKTAFSNGDKASAAMFAPYLVWVTLATALNTALALLNPAV